MYTVIDSFLINDKKLWNCPYSYIHTQLIPAFCSVYRYWAELLPFHYKPSWKLKDTRDKLSKFAPSLISETKASYLWNTDGPDLMILWLYSGVKVVLNWVETGLRIFHFDFFPGQGYVVQSSSVRKPQASISWWSWGSTNDTLTTICACTGVCFSLSIQYSMIYKRYSSLYDTTGFVLYDFTQLQANVRALSMIKLG